MKHVKFYVELLITIETKGVLQNRILVFKWYIPRTLLHRYGIIQFKPLKVKIQSHLG